jgi:hypothetical protein
LVARVLFHRHAAKVLDAFLREERLEESGGPGRRNGKEGGRRKGEREI